MLRFRDHILYFRAHFARDALRKLCSLLKSNINNAKIKINKCVLVNTSAPVNTSAGVLVCSHMSMFPCLSYFPELPGSNQLFLEMIT